jgi:hypothetical protein
MPVNFTIYGPFTVPTKTKSIKGGKVKIKQLDIGKNLWKQDEFCDFAQKKGCYVFANAVTRGSTPIYVGKTTKSFKSECFATHKKAMLNDFLAEASKTGLQIYLIVLESRKDCSDEIDLCETFLIQKCYEVNKRLLNIRKLAAKFTIKSFHGEKSKPTKAVSDFKKCLNIK